MMVLFVTEIVTWNCNALSLFKQGGTDYIIYNPFLPVNTNINTNIICIKLKIYVCMYLCSLFKIENYLYFIYKKNYVLNKIENCHASCYNNQ
jgi:hypothetical protein